jgi:hypothetical protein
MRKLQVSKMVSIGGLLGALFFSMSLADKDLAAPQPQWARPLPSLRRSTGSGPIAASESRHRLVITYHPAKPMLPKAGELARVPSKIQHSGLAVADR